MYSHMTVGTDDLERSRRFYYAVFSTLGVVREWNYPTASGYVPKGRQSPAFWVVRPFDEGRARPGNGTMPAFVAETRAAVDAFYTAALKNGGLDEGPPGRRPNYHKHYYGAYVRDPDGNKLCACCHKPYDGD